MSLQSMCEPSFGDDFTRCPIFPEQLAPAYSLARHFGHSWAEAPLEAFGKSCRFRYPDGTSEWLTTAADIERLTVLRKSVQWHLLGRADEPDAAFLGVTAPCNENAFLRHHPQGEALHWTVWDSGLVWLWCHTPDGACCLEAVVPGADPVVHLESLEDNRVTSVALPAVRVSCERAQGPFTARELALLEEALLVLLESPETVSEALQPLWQQL